VKCGVTETETCLKAITLALSNGNTVSTKSYWGRKNKKKRLLSKMYETTSNVSCHCINI